MQPIVRYFEGMERLSGSSGLALAYANEIHIDLKHEGTRLGKEILKHEKKHIKRYNEIKKGKNRMLVFLLDRLWDFYDTARINVLKTLGRL